MIDSHAHVAFRQFDDDREEVVRRARAVGVRWLEVGTDVQQSRAALSIAAQYPEDVLGATVGVHPSDVSELTEESWHELEELLVRSRVVAVGEVGLDYYHTSPDAVGLRVISRGGAIEEQKIALDRFVRLAVARQLPVVFHVRDPAKSPDGDRGAGGQVSAHDDLLAYLEGLSSDLRPRGVIHTFSGTRAQAQRYLGFGLYLSFSGVVTYNNAAEICAAAREVPLDRFLIETDCPFLTPAPHRGKRNEPSFVLLVAEKVAQLKQLAVGEVTAAAADNAEHLLRRTGAPNRSRGIVLHDD